VNAQVYKNKIPFAGDMANGPTAMLCYLIGELATEKKKELSRRRLHASVKCCVNERETEENSLISISRPECAR
jgi:hypothetical protein